MNAIEKLLSLLANKEQKIQLLENEIKRLEGIKSYHTQMADGAEQDIQEYRDKIRKLQ